MTSTEDDKVKKLPVRFKEPMPPDRSLIHPWEVGRPEACDHWRCTYIVDKKKTTVECGKCGGELNPMWVLEALCNREASFHEAAARYKDEMQRLSERTSTKCEWCSRMTRISRRSAR